MESLAATDLVTDAHPVDWKAFYDGHFRLVWRVLVRFGAPPEDLEDLSQEVFAIVHRKLAGFRGEATLETWLFSICRKVAARSRRRTRFRRAAMALFGRDVPTAPVPEARRDLERLLGVLPEAQRLTVLFHEVDGMSAAEIAKLFGCPEPTVYSRLRLAWQTLREEAKR